MTEDIFAIKELREIILAFPQLTPESQDSSGSRVPSLVHSASGDALWLSDHVVKRVVDKLQHAQQRLILSKLAEELDIGSKDFLALLGQRDIRPLWCYNAGLHTIVPPAELKGLLHLLQDTCSVSFVDFHDFCEAHDVHATDLRYHLRNINLSSPDDAQLGVGKWYEDSGNSSNGPEYIYTSRLLRATKESVRHRLQEATEARKSTAIDPAVFHGLDSSSSLCFTHKILESLLDFNKDFIVKCSLARRPDNEITFTPHTAAVAQKEQVILDFLQRANGWRSSGKPASKYMPCLPLSLQNDRQQTSADQRFAENAEAVEQVGSGEKLVRIGDYAVTYRALRTLADNVLATIEESTSAQIDAPRDVRSEQAASFVTKLYEIIVTDFSSDEDRIVRIGTYVAVKTSLEKTKKNIASVVTQEARKAWETHAKDPTASPFPDALPADMLLDMVLTTAPAYQGDFYTTVAKNEFGITTSTRNPAHQLWRSTIYEQESSYDAGFAKAYTTNLLARLDLYSAALQALEPGKLRSELAVLLSNYLTTNFLSDMLRVILDKTGLRPCGRHVVPAISRLETTFQSHSIGSVEPNAGSEVLDTIAPSYRKEGTKLKASAPTAEQLAEVKGSMLEETLTNARNSKSDRDGSRAYLCVVLIMWSKNNEGYVYATGRFVPRLLKLLRGKIDEAAFARLQELKEVVKGGSMTDEQRQELIGIATSDNGL